ncbi:MAG: hypothetical protein MN733_37140, partial [Nitrososphaera sp.]|nr:hypothetical protein [Nitrososphaera sp.]
VVDSIKYVDYAFICPVYRKGQDSTFLVLEELRPEFVVFPERKYKALHKYFEAIHCKLVIQPKIGNKSTSKIIKTIRKSSH